MKIGAHVSTAGGFLKMSDYVESIGAECAQIFAKSPRMWKQRPLSDDALAQMAKARCERGLGPTFTHTSYLINITTNNLELWEKSVDALADELVRASQLGCEGVNTHLGSVPDNDKDAAVKRAARGIEEAFARAGGQENIDTVLLLENTAGAGTIFGGPIEDICAVINECRVDKSKLGICIDSCHAWAYGYDVSGKEGWEEIHSIIDSTIGLESWQLTHANDSKFGRGERKDRHEWVGDGHIGSEGFQEMLKLPGLDHLCIVVEAPGEVPEKDIVNIERLKEMRENR